MAADFFTSDLYSGNADSGVDTGRIYTAIGNIVGGDVIVNGATFFGTGTSGTNWALTDAPANFGGGGNHSGLGDSIAGLFDAFQYSGNPAHFTVSGLTAGQVYQVTFYDQAWGLGADRTVAVSSSLAGTTAGTFSYNEDAKNLSLLHYTFTADAAGSATLSIAVANGTNASMHLYGFSNELLNAWTPASGNNWGTAANWSTGTAVDAVGANASFLGTGAATSVVLEANKTAGHLFFAGTAPYTVSGASTLTMQAATGGATIDAATGGMHTITSPVVLASDTAKVGGGSVYIASGITGGGALSVTNGTLALGGTNSYGGGTSIYSGTLRVGAAVTVDNPSFERPNTLANGTFEYSPAGSGWNLHATTGIASNNSPWFAPAALDGLQGAYLQGDSGTGISQSVNVDTAGLYNVSFLAVGRSGGNGPNGLVVQIDGSPALTLTGAQFSQANWQNYVTSAVNLTAGSHTIAFLGNNTLGGDKSTVIDKVQIGRTGLSTDVIPDSSAVSLKTGDATLDLNGNSETIGSLTGVSGSKVTLVGGTLTTGGNNGSTSFAGTVSGSGSLVKNGTGTMVLGSMNSFTGTMTVAGGGITLAIGASQTVGGLEGAGSLSLAQATSTAFSGDANSGLSGAKTYTHLLDFNASNGVTAVNGVSFTTAAPSGNDGNGHAWTLSGTNATFGGGGGSGMSKLLSDFYYGGNPGTLSLTGFTPGATYEVRLYSRDFGPAGDRLLNATFNTGAVSETLSNYDQNGIVGSNYLAYQFRADGGGQITVSMAPLNPGNTFHWYGVSAEAVTTLATTVTLGDAGNHQFDGPISGAGNIVKVGFGLQQLNGVNTYTGSTTISAGTLQLGSGNLPGSITGIGTLIKSGNGILALSAPGNNYSGGTTINGGTLKATALNATGTGPVTIAATGTWDIGLNNQTVAGLSGSGTVTRTGGSISLGADGASIISTSHNYLLKLDFGNNGGATVNGVAFDAVTTSGTGWSLTGAGTEFGEGNVSGPHTGYDQLVDDFYYGGTPGTLTFSNLTLGKTYTAALYTKVGIWTGRPQTATFDEDGAGPASSQVTFDPGDYGFQSYKFIAQASSMSITMAPTSAGTYHWFGATLEEGEPTPTALTIGDANNYTFSGAINGAIKVVKQGTGTQTLSGPQNYAELDQENGRTNLNASLANAVINGDGGILVINADATNSTVNVNGGNTTYFGASQTLNSLNIGNGGVAILGAPASGPEFAVNPVPEPGSAALIVGGFLTMLSRCRRRRS